MKHIRFCPRRKDKSKGVFFVSLSICLMALVALIILKIYGMEYVTIFGYKGKPFIFVSSFFFILAIIFLIAVKQFYCKRELALWAVLTKKIILTMGLLNFQRLKIKNVQKILVCNFWIYNNKNFERTVPKRARPRWAEFTGYNREHFDFKRFFILIPNNCDIVLGVRADASGKTRLTSENYKKYKNIANNKKIIMIDGTEENYKYLRQVFEYEKFEGANKYDVKCLEEFEELFADKIIRKVK